MRHPRRKGDAKYYRLQSKDETFFDDMLIGGKELPAAMHVSRATVRNWMRAGYIFEFGEMTTRGRCKAWLREQVREGRANWLMKRAGS